MIWSKEETLPRSEIEAIQLKKLKETVHYIYEKVAPYRRKMDEAGVKPEDIRTVILSHMHVDHAGYLYLSCSELRTALTSGKLYV